ncbi:hypothetical protein EYS14_23150 [Alteromonadaceae bacterium M269]|nr:hypothetical protein EYS14_23150 [Alteromonadaceae bacterium M269]
MNVLFAIFVCLLFFSISSFIEHRRMKKIALGRGQANICEYARSFNYRVVDTKIMREVWNEVQLLLGKFGGEPFPIKADDKFEETYRIHPDDIDDIYWDVADRLGIETGNVEVNPYFEQVATVKDLVLFLDAQPRKVSKGLFK